MALSRRKSAERQDVGDGGIVHGKIRQQSFLGSAGAMANAVGDMVAFFTEDFKLFGRRKQHGEMEAKSFVGGGTGRYGDSGRASFRSKRKSEIVGRQWVRHSIRSEGPVEKKQLGLREFDGASHGKEDVVPQLDIMLEFGE